MTSISCDVNFIIADVELSDDLHSQATNTWTQVDLKKYTQFLFLNTVRRHFMYTYSNKIRDAFHIITTSINKVKLRYADKQVVPEPDDFVQEVNSEITAILKLQSYKLGGFVESIQAKYSILQLTKKEIFDRANEEYVLNADRTAELKLEEFFRGVEMKLNLSISEYDIDSDEFTGKFNELTKINLSYNLDKKYNIDYEDFEIFCEFLIHLDKKVVDMISFDKNFCKYLTEITNILKKSCKIYSIN